ncbi:hypothetical protein WB91_17395 [bacteria symbiont BFo1 of Frankliniella occidentalis]|nr:hypothetical protein WB91_17395 [bacteria symbiont BFo1 of Frankliniella occidentalis]
MGVQGDFINRARRNNHCRYRLMSFECTAAVYILALVIALFRLFRKVAATFGMGGGKANRAMHHFGVPSLSA